LKETDHFINLGYGWLCKHCRAEVLARSEQSTTAGRARFHTEGEAEDKEAALSTTALARWRDSTRRALFCPLCSIEETINKA
jgi:hypothetical protein